MASNWEPGGGEEPVRPPVIGRDGEIAAIRSFLAGVPGRGSALVLEGEAGIGKTTLWREAVAAARSGPYRVLSARPGETESKPSHGGLVDLLEDALDLVIADLPRPQASTLETALLHGARPIEQPGSVAVAVTSALRALADRGPVVVAVDDFQWLDAPSRRVLVYVARRLDRVPVALVVTERPPTTLAFPADEHVTRLRVGPLSLAALHHLVRERIGISLERPVLVRVATASGGNPLYALEIARALPGAGGRTAPGTPLPIPADLRALVSRRLTGLPAAAHEAVLAAYCLWRPTPELLEGALCAAGQPPAGLTVAVEAEALELGVETVRLAHPLLGSVLYGRMAPSDRRALHARLATLQLEGEEHAYHLSLAAAQPDRDTAAVAETTAAGASSRGAPETAAGLLELAVRLTPPAEQEARLRRLDALAMALYRAGDSMAAVTRWEEIARTSPAGPTRAHAIWRLVEFGSATVSGGFEEAPQTLASILDEAAPDTSLQAEIQSSMAEFLLWGEGPSAAEPHAHAAVALALQDAAPRPLAHALTISGITDFFLGCGIPDAVFERALALEAQGLDMPTEVLPSAYVAYVHTHTGESPALAASLLDAKLEQARRDGDEASLPFLLWQRCEVAVAGGQLEAAGAYATACEDAVESSGRSGRRGGALYCHALVEAHRGHLDEAFDLARRAMERDAPRRVGYLVALYGGVLGFVELGRGRHRQALDWFEPAHRQLREAGYSEPAMFRHLPDHAEALASLGRLDDAEAVLAPFEAAALRLQRRSALAAAARARGFVLSVRGETDAALAELDRAIASERQLGRPFQQARAEMVRGEVARRGRHPATARDAFWRALELFEGLGSLGWARQALEQLARLGARLPVGLQLTPTEGLIAQLVATGYSNPQIAVKLFMSRKTVERHLTNAYQRLGVRTRAELAALVGQGGRTPPAD